MTEPLRGVMIGAGSFAKYHADAWNRISSARITAIADVDFEKAQVMANEFLIPEAYDDAVKMIEAERPDFVDVITPPDTLADMLRMASGYRTHVICQKPSISSWEKCLATIQACRTSGVRVVVHENWRWQPWYREIRRMLEADRFGNVFQATFRLRLGAGRGSAPYPGQPSLRTTDKLLIQETVVHLLDTLRFLLGEIESVFCRTRKVNPAVKGEDSALVILRFKSGQQGLIDANAISGPSTPSKTMGVFFLEGDRASARLNHDGDIWFSDYGEEESRHSFPKPDTGYRGDSVLAMQEHAINCLQTGRVAESEAEAYMKTVAAVFACYESAATGQMIKVEKYLNKAKK